MRFEAFVLVVALAASIWLARRPPSVDPCLANCLARSQELRCARPDRCAEQCEKVKTAVYCKKPLDAFMKCAFAQSTWVCGMDGVPELGSHHGHPVCEAQRDQMSLCLHQSRGKL